MKIYTKAGDQGETGLFGGQRLSKTSARIAAIGDIDELNAAIGVARSLIAGSSLFAAQPEGLNQELAQVQGWLFELGAELGTPPGHRNANATLSDKEVDFLEESIDKQTSALEPLKSFILPGGSPVAAQLHAARCICRRAERQLLALHALEPIRGVAMRFLNRLSDWIFTAARTANRLASVEDIKWSK